MAVLGAANLPATATELRQRKEPCVLDRARSRSIEAREVDVRDAERQNPIFERLPKGMTGELRCGQGPGVASLNESPSRPSNAWGN